jgi:hypothetical protein
MIDFKERMITGEIKKLVPILGKEKAERISRAYLLADEDTRKRIFEMVDVVKACVFSDEKLRGTLLLEPPTKEAAAAGDLEVGQIMYGNKEMYPLKITKDMLLTHIGVFGSSGYGKTNIAYFMVKQLIAQGVPVLIFDFSKRNYRELLTMGLNVPIKLYTVGRDVAPLRFNPLIGPDNVPLSQWIKEFASIFDHAYWLLGGGKHVIMKSLENVFREKKEPTISDLKCWLSEYSNKPMSARERNWLATAIRPLDSLCMMELGDVLNCVDSISPAEFFSGPGITVLELDALDTSDKTFFIEIVMQWVRNWLLGSQEREKLRGAIVLEEAHHILNREKSKKIGSETVMDLVFREIRELGMGVIYMDQHPSLMSYPALGNTSTHIYMNLGLDTKYSSDVMDAANMLGLSDDDSGYVKKLPVGYGIVLCRRLGFTDPFMIKFPMITIKKGSISDEMVASEMGTRFLLEKRPARKAPAMEKLPDQASLSDGELKIIRAIGNGEGFFTSQIYSAISMSGTQFNKLVKRLQDVGLVGKVRARIDRNVLFCYFLSGTGQKVYNAKFGLPHQTSPEKKLHATEDMGRIIGLFKREYETRKNSLLLDMGAEIVEAMTYSCHDEEPSDTLYHICPTDKLKNILVQKKARQFAETGKRSAVLVATAKEFGAHGKFTRIDFETEHHVNYQINK